MPYKTSWEEKGIYWKYTGIVSSEDISNSNNEFYGDARSDSALYQIADFSDIRNNVLDKFAVEKIAAMDYAQSLSIRHIKVAFVIAQPEIKESIQEYIELALLLRTNWTFDIFDDLNSARKWVSQC